MLLFFCALLCVLSACSTQNGSKKESSSVSDASAVVTTEAHTVIFADKMKLEIDSLMSEKEFEGAAYLTQNGSVVWQYANGKNVVGKDITVDTPLPVGSVSKQFCAAAIITLRDSGKLSLEDTLDKYFPDYTEGKKLNIRNLLTMRSGISDIVNHGSLEGVSETNTYDENRKAVLKAIFEMPLSSEPNSRYEYSNSNYILLSAIVEEVSGQPYIEYLRSTLLEPFGMNSTGSVDEYQGSLPAWAGGLDYSDITGLATGAGDIISAASDMDKWMTGLRSGTVISSESYREMTTDYSSESAAAYGFGINLNYKNGVGHPGNIMIADIPYAAFEYLSEEYGYNLILEGSGCMDVLDLGTDILNVIYG